MDKKTHWKSLINPDYIGAYALEPGQDLVVTIDHVKKDEVVGTDGKKEECTVAFLKGQKPLIVNVTNAKTISKVLGSPYIEDWAGGSIQLFSTNVKAFGDVVEALRVRPFKPRIKEPVKLLCEDCGSAIADAGGKTAAYLAQYTKRKTGRQICYDCALKLKPTDGETADAEPKQQETTTGSAEKEETNAASDE